MVLALVRHAESVENATKYDGFYVQPRPYDGPTAHHISRALVGLTPRGFRQALWLADALGDLADAATYTSTYRRSIDTAAVAWPQRAPLQSPLLDEQHYGAATYMTKDELFTTHPDGADDRRHRKHLWVPPGGGRVGAVDDRGPAARRTAADQRRDGPGVRALPPPDR